MAFDRNNATTATSYKLVFGIDPESAKLLPFCNLSNEEKEKYGIPTSKKEQQWIVEKEDNNTGEKYNQAIIELYFKVEKSTLDFMNGKIFPIRYYIGDRERPVGRTSGKMQFINDKAETAWLLSENDEAKYLTDREGLRRALDGEGDFMDALKQLTNIRNGIYVFNWNKIFSGDFTEVRQTIKDALAFLKEKGKTNKFSVFYFVRKSQKVDENGIPVVDDNGKEVYRYFQGIYTKAFTPNKIRKNVESFPPIDAIYEKEGVLTNYLTVFDETMPTRTVIDNRENAEDLPF